MKTETKERPRDRLPANPVAADVRRLHLKCLHPGLRSASSGFRALQKTKNYQTNPFGKKRFACKQSGLSRSRPFAVKKRTHFSDRKRSADQFQHLQTNSHLKKIIHLPGRFSHLPGVIHRGGHLAERPASSPSLALAG
jgi:hypothetical protein